MLQGQLSENPSYANRIKIVKGDYLRDLGVPLGDEVISVAPGPAPLERGAGIGYPKNAALAAANLVSEKGRIYIVADLINNQVQADEVAKVAINRLYERGLTPKTTIVGPVSGAEVVIGKNPLGIPLTSPHFPGNQPWAIYIDLR